jgi:hypothetical protein
VDTARNFAPTSKTARSSRKSAIACSMNGSKALRCR